MDWIVPLLTALITGTLSLIGVMVTNNASNKKIENQLITSQAVTDTKIENLTQEVRKHNDFASRIPVMQEQISHLDKRVDQLEAKDSNRAS